MGNLAVEKNINTIRKYIHRFDLLEQRISRLSEVIIEPENQRAGDKEELCLFWEELLFLLDRLQTAVTDNILFASQNWTEEFESVSNLLQIDAKAVDGNLYMHAPFPAHRSRETMKGLSRYVSYKINNIVYDLKFYKKKYLLIINVYQKTGKHSEQPFYDFDNFDYKSLIDEACRGYVGADSPKTTKLIFASVFSDRIPPMTYLIICDQDKPMDFSDKGLTECLERVWVKESEDQNAPNPDILSLLSDTEI